MGGVNGGRLLGRKVVMGKGAVAGNNEVREKHVKNEDQETEGRASNEHL